MVYDAYKTRCSDIVIEKGTAKGITRFRPLGVMLIIGPYNYPITTGKINAINISIFNDILNCFAIALHHIYNTIWYFIKSREVIIWRMFYFSLYY